MANIAKEASIRMFTYPLRILIIINSIILPILLGIIVYFIFKFKKPVENIINKAIGIEKYVEDNIQLGVNVIFKAFDDIQALTNPDNITTFLNDDLLPSIATKFDHLCKQNGLNEYTIPAEFNIIDTTQLVDDIKATFTNLTHFDIADLQLNKLSDDLTTVLTSQLPQHLAGGGKPKEAYKNLLKQFMKQNFTIANILTYGQLYENHLDGMFPRAY